MVSILITGVIIYDYNKLDIQTDIVREVRTTGGGPQSEGSWEGAVE